MALGQSGIVTVFTGMLLAGDVSLGCNPCGPGGHLGGVCAHPPRFIETVFVETVFPECPVGVGVVEVVAVAVGVVVCCCSS